MQIHEGAAYSKVAPACLVATPDINMFLCLQCMLTRVWTSRNELHCVSLQDALGDSDCDNVSVNFFGDGTANNGGCPVVVNRQAAVSVTEGDLLG